MFENLKAEMARHNKKNSDVAEILGITADSVSFKLNGNMPFTVHEVWKLADVFNCSIDYLAGKFPRRIAKC